MGTMVPSLKPSVLKLHAFYIGLFSVYILLTQWTSLQKFPVDVDDNPSLQSLTSSYSDRYRSFDKRSLRHREPLGFKPHRAVKNVPSCAEGLVVELLDESHEFRCSGLLLRDDLVIADTACAAEAHVVSVTQPEESFLLYMHESGAKLSWHERQILSRTALQGPSSSALMSLVEIEMPRAHYQSGWPRHRMFVYDKDKEHHDHSVWDDTTRVLQVDRGLHIQVACFGGNTPVVSLPTKTDQDSPLANVEILRFPLNRTTAAAMENKLGEKWWVPKAKKTVLKRKVFSRKRLYMGTNPNTTVDVVRALGERGVLEAEDPKSRNGECLAEYFQMWEEQEPFSGEPFYQWLDFGSGRFLASESYERAEIEEDPCAAMDDEDRAKAIVIPRFVDDDESEDDEEEEDGEEKGSKENVGKVVLRYEQSGLPVEGGDMLFVWGLDGKFYVHANEGSAFHHICFFRALPVRTAGEIYVGEHGALETIFNDSGHYKPSDWHFRLFYRHLKSLMPEMKPRTVIWRNEYTERETREWLDFHFSP